MLFGVYKNVTDPKQYELLEMSRISGFVDRARGEGRANYRAEREEEQGNAYQTGGASSSFFTLTAYE